MGLFTVTARVRLMSEEDMDNYFRNEELGIDADSSKWVWREVALRTFDIKRVIGYNSNKCIILCYDDTQTLVKESFEDVYQKWQENLGYTEEAEPEEDEISEDEEENDEEKE
jgi:hypothetical protein